MRDFRKLTREIQIRLRPRIDALASNPRPPGAKKLRGGEELWRIRIGDYQTVYQVQDRTPFVLVARVAHRGDVYR